MALLDKAGPRNIAGTPVCLTGSGSHVSSSQVLAELNRAKALFQMRAIATAMGCPSIIRDVDGDGLMLTVEPLQFISPCHEDASA